MPVEITNITVHVEMGVRMVVLIKNIFLVNVAETENNQV